MTDKQEEKDVEIQLDLEDMAPVEDEKPAKAEKQEKLAANDEESPEKGIAELKKRLEEEQKARWEAENRVRQQQAEVQKVHVASQDKDLTLINGAIKQVKTSNDMLKNEYKAALTAGDYDKAADIQESMAVNAAKLLQLENGKVALENKLKQPVEPMARTNDPVEQVASQLSPRSASWVRAHPECVRDQKLYAKMIGAHNFAVADGYVPDSDAYFDFIEKSLGYKDATEPSESVEAAENPQAQSAQVSRPRSSPSAAPTSKIASSGARNSNVVRLTAQEREIAEMMKMTPEEYARNKVLAQKEGRFDR